MSKAIALARVHLPVRVNATEGVRALLVWSCGLALLAAGPLLPSLG